MFKEVRDKVPWHLSGLVQPPGKSSIFSACMGLNLIACSGIISVVSILLIVTGASGNQSDFWKRWRNFSSPLNHHLSPFLRSFNRFHSYHVLPSCLLHIIDKCVSLALHFQPLFCQKLIKRYQEWFYSGR